MPPDVALEYLTERYARINSAMTRSAREAREKYYVSEATPKPFEYRIANRLRRMPIDRLHRAIRRCGKRLRSAEQKFEILTVDFIRAELMQKVIVPLTESLSALRSEIDLRELDLRSHARLPSEHIDPRIRRQQKNRITV